mgnify:CR=1 FL=1
MIKAIAHICIQSKDLNASQRFYCDVLGLKKKFDFLRNGSRIGFYLQINEHNFIEVFQGDPSTSAQSAVMHFCLEVDDIDATMDTLRAAGIEVTDKKMGADQSWQAWLADPDGVRIELHQYTDQSCQHTGADCIFES